MAFGQELARQRGPAELTPAENVLRHRRQPSLCRAASHPKGTTQDTICQIYFGDSLLHHLAQARYHVDPARMGWVDLMIDTFWTGRGPLDGTEGDSARMIERAELWNQEVRDTVPAQRLLVWEPKDGWEPLCEFIGVDVPAEELPRVNDTDAFRAGIMGGAVAALNGWWEQKEAA